MEENSKPKGNNRPKESRKKNPSKTDGFFVGEFRISPVSYAQSCKSAKIVMISVKSKAFSNEQGLLKETPFSEDVRFSGCPLPSPNSKVGSLACKSVKMAVNLLKRNVQTNPSRAKNCATFKTQSLAKYSDFIKTGPIYHAGLGACQRIQPGVSRGVFIEPP